MPKVKRGTLDKALVHQFILSGHCVITCHNTASNTHITFMIDEVPNGTAYWVKVRGDKDRNIIGVSKEVKKDKRNWLYMGMAKKPKTFFTTSGSKVSKTSKSFISFEKLLEKSIEWMRGEDKWPTVDIYHEGFCGSCGRPLTNPKSISRGYGPDCYGRLVNEG